MSNWYVLKDGGGNLVSYVTDDSTGFASIPVTLTKVGPYASLQAAQSANEPKITISPSADAQLQQTLVAVNVGVAGYTTAQLAQAIQLILKNITVK